MKKKKTQQPSKAKKKSASASSSTRKMLGDVLQQLHPPEFRIVIRSVDEPLYGPPGQLQEIAPLVLPSPQPPLKQSSADQDRLLVEVATCLWYLKTKHFRRPWADQDSGDDDPRLRRALSRLNKGIDALTSGGIHVQDPTDTRYPAGGEALMRPLEFTPTEGLTYDRVTETVVPIVFNGERLIQRAEVFVAVPMVNAPQSTDVQPSNSTSARPVKSNEQTTPPPNSRSSQ